MKADLNELIAKLAEMDMRRATIICDLFMQKVEQDGGVAAVMTDMKNAYGKEFDIGPVKHAMTCGGAIILMTMREAFIHLNGGGSIEVEGGLADPKSEQESERAASDLIDRIRKLH